MAYKDKNNTPALQKELVTGIPALLMQTALIANSAIQDRTPVRTGRLKSEFIPQFVTPTHVEIQNQVVYAPYVEFGTVRQAPRAMAREGFDASVDRMEKFFAAGLSDIIKANEI